MTTPNQFNTEKIRLGADGVWYHGGVEITHERTVAMFFKNVTFTRGRYFLTGEQKPVPIEVEDVAYFIRDVNRRGATDYEITISNGKKETLNVATLDVDSQDRPYCRVDNGRVRARFDRKAYYELMKDLSEQAGFYGLLRDGMFYPIQRKEKPQPKVVATPVPVPVKKSAKKIPNKKLKPSGSKFKTQSKAKRLTHKKIKPLKKPAKKKR